jgi:hypothetical protein
MTSVLSSFELAAWALGLTNTALMTKHAKARRKELVDIKNLPLSFIIEPVDGGPADCDRSKRYIEEWALSMTTSRVHRKPMPSGVAGRSGSRWPKPLYMLEGEVTTLFLNDDDPRLLHHRRERIIRL